jgi:hypothetical protein
MHVHVTDLKLPNDDPFNVENIRGPQESIGRLQYMIALLLEKNEQFRQKLVALGYDERS